MSINGPVRTNKLSMSSPHRCMGAAIPLWRPESRSVFVGKCNRPCASSLAVGKALQDFRDDFADFVFVQLGFGEARVQGSTPHLCIPGRIDDIDGERAGLLVPFADGQTHADATADAARTAAGSDADARL